MSYLPVSDEANEVIGVSLAVTDITARKAAEEALRRSEAHYRSMVELNPQVLWIMDPQGRNLDLSPRWDKTTGQLKPLSREHEWLTSVHPEDLESTALAIADSRRNGLEIDVQYRVSGGESGWLWKRSRGAPRFDEAGNIVCWYGSVEQIDSPSQSGKTLIAGKAGLSVETIVRVEVLSLTADRKERRAQAIEELEILDTVPEQEFDDLVALASEICETPISLISVIDTERQWFKAVVGLAASQTPIATSFCTHTISQEGLFVVADASKDERFKNKSLVVDSPHIRFYAGLPITSGGVPIGSLCVIDTVPRTLAPSQIKALTILSHQVQARIELRSSRRKEAREINARGALKRQIATGSKNMKPICPQCQNDSSRASKARFYDLPLYMTGMIPLRCDNCQYRFYRHRLAVPMANRSFRDS
jgi:PAS domain S-box-containing protein